MNLQTDPATSSALVKEQVENKIQLVKQKIGELKKIEHSLEQLSDLCCGDGPVSDCPIIDFLKQ